ncbi:MAG: histidine kinase [Bacteroidetes bacterium]|nr:histidine kinase [Bacteroidota bacterium]
MSNDLQRKHRIEAAVHALIWVALFYIPVALSTGTEIGMREVATFFWSQLVFMAVIFYANYLLFVERYLYVRSKRWLFIALNIGLLVLLYGVKHLLFNLLHDGHGGGHHGPPVVFIWYSDFLVYLIPIAFAVAIRSGKRLTNFAVYRTEAENAKLQAELQTLKYQLQPHFFFNALNTVYSLIETDPDKARASIHSLSKLMRHLLAVSDKATIPLAEEIDFLNKYIALMRLRLSPGIRVVADLPAQAPDVRVAPLLFISLVENAFKHGIFAGQQGDLHFTLHATPGGEVLFIARNGMHAKPGTDLAASGIGLENLRKRLALLYPGRHELTIRAEQDRYEAVLRVQPEQAGT